MAPATEPLAYLDGSWIPARQLAIPIHDAGFVMGAAVTDMCRTFQHRLYRWADHLGRFRRGCQKAHIPLAWSDSALASLAEELADHNAKFLPATADLALVMLATPGPVGYYAGQAGGAGDGPATFAMHTFPLPFGRYQRLFTRGAHLVIPSIRHVPGLCVDPHIKQRSRMHWWLADRQVQTIEPGATALLLDTAGFVTETAAANFLLVKGSKVISPPRMSILEGISLQVARELCNELAIPWEERPISLAECLGAAEAMLTSTPYCVAGVSQIQGIALPWPGPVLQRLREAWNTKVGVDIMGQIIGTIAE